MSSLGSIIKERRKARRLLLRQLSDESGVSTSHLGRIERGERFPSGRILRRLAEPLGFTETELLKIAGFLSRDESDDRLDRFKKEIRKEIATEVIQMLLRLDKKIDSL